jgi:ABC-2 type transport system permease protein
MKAWTLITTYLRIGLMNELQYRVNFFIQVLQSLISLGTGLIGLALVFQHTTDLAGWTRPELLAVMGVHILMGGLIQSLITPNMGRLMGDIQDGTLDFPLTKPADAQLIISVREFRLWQLVDVLMGLGVLGVAALEIQARLRAGETLGAVGSISLLMFVAALLLGAVMVYSFWLILTCTAFWVVRVDEMVNLFQGLYAAGRWPVGIYPDWLRYGLTFLVPVAFAVTVPAQALTGRLSGLTLLGAAGLALGLSLLARFVWKLGLKNYSGASA